MVAALSVRVRVTWTWHMADMAHGRHGTWQTWHMADMAHGRHGMLSFLGSKDILCLM